MRSDEELPGAILSITLRRQTLRLTTLLSFALVLLLAATWGSRPLVHDDLFLHLATGRFIVDTASIPSVDPFSFTQGDQPWVSHEWGFGLLTYAIHTLGGDWALVVFKSLTTVAILLLLFLLMHRAAAPGSDLATPWLVALLALGLWSIDQELVLRASLISSLLMLILLWLLSYFDATGSRASMIVISGLFLFWGNFHGEVLFGLFVLALYSLESLLGRGRVRIPGIGAIQLRACPQRPALRLFAACLLLTLVNPNGFGVLMYPFRLAKFLSAGAVPLEMGHFTYPTPVNSAPFFLLLAILLFSFLPAARRRTLSLTEIATVGAFLALALRSHRFVFYFVLFALPLIARLLPLRAAPRAIRSHARATGLALALMLCAGVTSAMIKAWNTRPPGALSRHFPHSAVTFLAAHGLDRGRPFNHQNFGGYLHWRLDAPVFWDGRNLLFAPLMAEIRHMPLADVTQRWHLDYLLLTQFEYNQIANQIDPEHWALVHWDDFSALWLARTADSSPLLRSTELHRIHPFGGVGDLQRLARSEEALAEARRELDRVLELEPRCQRALYLQGLLSLYAGDPVRAAQWLRSSLAIGPNPLVAKTLAAVASGANEIELD